MSLCLKNALEIQLHLRQRQLAVQGKKVTPDLQAVMERFPELQQLLGEFQADATMPLDITSASGSQMIAVRILRAHSLPPTRSAFPEARQVTLLILQNASTFYFTGDLGPGGFDLDHLMQDAYLITPETTLVNRLPSHTTCEGPHIITAKRSLPWVIENFEVLHRSHLITVKDWNRALAALENRIQTKYSYSHLELYHTSVRQLLERFPNLVGTGQNSYRFCGREDLDKPLVDCIPEEQADELKPSFQFFRRHDSHRSVTQYHKTCKSPVFLKKLGLPPHVENRLRQRMQDVKNALQHCQLSQETWPGFCEITDVVPLNNKRWLLLEENGFSAVWKNAFSITPETIKAQYCLPAAKMEYPPDTWNTCCHLVPQAEVRALMEVSQQEDPFELATGFLGYLRLGIQHCDEHEPADNVWFANLCCYLAHRLNPLWSPERREIIVLARRGRPPYRVQDALECLRPEPSSSALNPKEPPLNLLQRQDNCAASIRALYQNIEFLQWKPHTNESHLT